MTGMNLVEQQPATYKSLVALSAQAEAGMAETGLDPLLAELVRIRVSQLNGCAFCLRTHTRDALAKGESADRLAVLAAWGESGYFTARERAALAVAERTTRPGEPVRWAYEDEALTDDQASAVSWLAIVMNAWNRVALMSRTPVAP
ncbi:carboxymuconolactone decarboxylase family protein [Streptomyces laurentii]|uniref:carboxymuconolactone decarboxylase family protein n=1 Tax=Streptomyces laurentii TaxID=39478 RepID=UPI00368B9D97